MIITSGGSSAAKEIVPRDQWETLTVNQLIDQKNIMMDRWQFLREQNVTYIPVFEAAIADLDALITKKNIFSVEPQA